MDRNPVDSLNAERIHVLRDHMIIVYIHRIPLHPYINLCTDSIQFITKDIPPTHTRLAMMCARHYPHKPSHQSHI